MKAISADGQSLGKIVALHDDEFVIEKGLFFVKDYYARYDDVDEVRADDTAVLRLRKEDFEPVAREGEREERRPAAPETSTARGAEMRVPVAEEHLTATTHPEQVGEVRVRKEVKTEQEHLSVPVRREEVTVERVPVGESVAPGQQAFREEEVRVPIIEEKVEVHTRPVVKEEVRVSKEEHRETQRVSEPVRREEVHVEESGKGRRGH